MLKQFELEKKLETEKKELLEKDFLLDFEQLKRKAEAGDPSAQLQVGLSLEQAWNGCIIDYKQSREWIALAKKSASPAGLCAQGICYAGAICGVNIINNDKARECYSKAAELGYIPAICKLGQMIVNANSTTVQVHGMNIPKKDQEKLAEAVRMFTQCAEAGYVPAIALLGCCYINGNGVQRNAEEGIRLLKIAAEKGHGGAKRLLGQCYLEFGFARGLVKRDVAEARKWLRSAVKQGVELDDFTRGYLNPCCSIL